MSDKNSYDLELAGCTPEPLMAYLKALGILRLVSDQKDESARGWWKNDVFWLRSALDGDALVQFFLEEYKPTPIVVPWSGGDFFGVNWQAQPGKLKKTPTASKAIESILTTRTPRFEPYRSALQASKAAMDDCGIDTKEKMGKQKWKFIEALRSTCPQASVIDWIDAAAVIGVEKFAALLGSGGGSDGNTHFSDNFMQNLWDVLQDFDEQREPIDGQPNQSCAEASYKQLRNALFKSPTKCLIEKRTSSLYDAGAVGGPNATQGMERESLSNPWNVILALEGTVSFAGAATKRLGVGAPPQAVFPFQVAASVTTQDGLADKQRAGTEVWIPLWTRPARSNEVLALLREGRAQCGPRPARTGVDMARAIASLGVDRGIEAFGRYAILKGRVGGENYNTAVSLGRFCVTERQHADLLREIDRWIDRFRTAVETSAKASDKVPRRFASVLRGIDSSVLDFCKYGGNTFFQRIIVALGQAERELAMTLGKVGQSKTKSLPLAGLSPDWIRAANDNSPEFEIALTLAGIYDSGGKIGSLRSNLEPVVVWRSENGELAAKWAEKDRAVVWNSASLSANLAAVLRRRLMDGQRNGCAALPLAAANFVSLDTVSRFLARELNEQRIEDLLWGLMLLPQTAGMLSPLACDTDAPPPLPRVYALLKLLFLPQPIAVNGAFVTIKPEPSIVSLLNAGHIGEACRIAMRRLRASGLSPLPHPRSGGVVRDGEWQETERLGIDGQRLAATLLLPLSYASIERLRALVVRGAAPELQTI